MLMPNGLQYAFGMSSASRIYNQLTNDPVSWRMDSITDPLSNKLTVEYWRDAEQLYPQLIQYSGDANGPGLETIKFSLFAPR